MCTAIFDLEDFDWIDEADWERRPYVPASIANEAAVGPYSVQKRLVPFADREFLHSLLGKARRRCMTFDQSKGVGPLRLVALEAVLPGSRLEMKRPGFLIAHLEAGSDNVDESLQILAQCIRPTSIDFDSFAVPARGCPPRDQGEYGPPCRNH